MCHKVILFSIALHSILNDSSMEEVFAKSQRSMAQHTEGESMHIALLPGFAVLVSEAVKPRNKTVYVMLNACELCRLASG